MVKYHIDHERVAEVIVASQSALPNRHIVICWIVACIFAACIAIYWSWQGAWWVMPFAGLEILVLGLACWWVRRRLKCQQHIWLTPNHVKVREYTVNRSKHWSLPRKATTLIVSRSRSDDAMTLILRAAANEIEIGHYLAPQDKQRLLAILKACIYSIPHQKETD